MKKLFIFAGFVLICGYLRAEISNHNLNAQFRVWKSSSLDPSATYVGTQISTSPIIFHAVIGSGTVNVGGNSSFILFQSTGMTVPATDMSTKAFIPLEVGTNNPTNIYIGPLDVLVTTHSYFNKAGASNIQYLWDYLDSGNVKFNRFPKD